MSIAFTRRAVLVAGTSLPVASALASCQTMDATRIGVSGRSASSARQGRLTFRPPTRPPAGKSRTGRFHMQGAAEAQPAAVYVPPTPRRGPLRLVVMLHGAGGVARSAVNLLREEADRHRLLLLAPKSSAGTWDVLGGGYGPDVANIDRLLTAVAARYRLRWYTLGGFSDGASYALSLGLTNGDVFDSLIAFSPGFETADGRSRGWTRSRRKSVASSGPLPQVPQNVW